MQCAATGGMSVSPFLCSPRTNTAAYFRYCRQTLAGGNYGLLNTTTFEPNPDYYAAMAWRQLMGTAVLDTCVSGASSDVRGYSHCARGQAGAVTFLLLNLGNTSASVSLPGSGGRDEYHFTSSSLHSQSVFLNGNELKVNGAAIPDLVPVQRPAASPLALMPTSYVFAVVKDPSAPC
jgi:heparanase 1